MNRLKTFWLIIDDFVLELGRLALIGAYGSVFPFILARLELLSASDATRWALILIAIAKAFDRWLHEKEIVVKGLTGF